MTQPDLLTRARSSSSAPTCGDRATGCSAPSSEADDAVQEAWLRLNRTGRRRDHEPRRLADDRRRARLPRHAALPARRGARSTSARWSPSRSSAYRRGHRPGARGAAGRLGRARDAGGARARWRPPSGSRSCCTTCSPCPFDEIAPIVGRSPAATRQLASRGTAARARRGDRHPKQISQRQRTRSSARSSPPRAPATSNAASRARPRRRAVLRCRTWPPAPGADPRCRGGRPPRAAFGPAPPVRRRRRGQRDRTRDRARAGDRVVAYTANQSPLTSRHPEMPRSRLAVTLTAG